MNNAKLLFTATVVVSTLAGLATTTAMAESASRPLARSEPSPAYAQAATNASLRRSEYDLAADVAARSPSSRSRAEVVADLNRRGGARAIGSAGSRSYNPFGNELTQASTLARAEVKADVLQAVADGSLRRTDYDGDQTIRLTRRASGLTDLPVLARSGNKPGRLGNDG